MRRPSSWASTTTRRARSVNRSNNVSLPPCSGDPWDESTHGPPEATQGDLDLPVTVPIGTSDRPHERHAAAGARRRVSDTIRRGTSVARSEAHTSELQSLMRISYALFCL